MSEQVVPSVLNDDFFVWAEKNAKSMAVEKMQPVTVDSYFDALRQIDDVRRDLVNFGGKYGATRFGGSFDLRNVCKAYMESSEARAAINRITGVR